MGATTSEAVKMLDGLIADVQKRLDVAQRAAETIPTLSTDLLALQRARTLAAGTSSSDGSGTAGLAEPAMVRRTPVPIHQTDMVLNILRTAGRPMTVKDIMAALHDKVPGAKEMTIVSHLVRFMQKGKVKRTAPSTYEIVK